MKRRPGAAQRQASQRVPGFTWRTRDDVIAAVRALQAEPLPPITVAADATSLDVCRALERAYAENPVVIAAKAWAKEETRSEGTFVVLHYITYLPVNAARRWHAAQPSDAAPF